MRVGCGDRRLTLKSRILKIYPVQLRPSFRRSTLDTERARLATVLEQITDGVLIADTQGIVHFANPAAGRLFQTSRPVNRSLTEVICNHQLVEAWWRCQQTREL